MNRAGAARYDRIFRKALGFLARKKKIQAHFKNSKVRLELLPNAELRKLKKKYLKKNVPVVDVLSFPEPDAFPHPEAKSGYLGEIYLNQAIAAREPARAKALVVHGLLHLLGYRHHRKRDRIEMENLEADVLEHLR